ncbi:MAG: FlgD immunoglobulin-like domain containing protein [Candidatus Cloacimonadales bacterium]|nr:FlgD immunoglobulin-like domain containing protein [Candidatus Cloacimonadales bacterium]
MKPKLLFLFVLICANSWLQSVTWHIKLDGTGNFATIQAGINASSHTDTVLVYPGTYYEYINYNGKNITVASLEIITGDDQYIYSTIIDGQRLSSCVSIVSEETDTTLRGLTITNGQGLIQYPFLSGGINIWGDSDLLVSCDVINCIITKNYAFNSAGMCIRDGLVLLSGCSIRKNYASRFGGGIGISAHSQVTFDPVNRCSIYDNFAGSGVDMFVETIYFDELNVIVDTFTVAEPDKYFAQVFPGNRDFIYNFDILENYIVPYDYDIYVSPDGADANSGLSPDDPLKTINLAVRNIASNSENPRTVHLATGTYSESLNQQLFAFGCKAHVNIIGDDMYTTIIDGESENHPFFITGSDYINSTISNLTFTNGIYYNSLLMIYYSDSIRFENINIQNGIITDSGVAIISSTAGGNIQLKNVTVNNVETQDGGNAGVWFNGTTFFKAVDCTFSNNTCVGSTAFSAGLYAISSGDILIENCKFFGNNATGTTWYGYASSLLVTDDNDEMGNVFINNCLFYDNVVNNGKSTIYAQVLDNDVLTFTNNTLFNNDSPYGIEFQGNIQCHNNILRNNGNYEIALFDKSGQGIISEIDLSHNNIQGGQSAIYNQNNANIVNWGEGNIDADPLFFLSGDDPYQLTEFSPCLDTGTQDTTGLFLPPWDLLHNQRVWDGNGNGSAIIDMGAYEYGAEPYVEAPQNLVPSTPNQLTNYPNPFNPSTTIKFSVTQTSSFVTLEIYNIKGQKVKTLIDAYLPKGVFSTTWNGRDSSNKRVSSGEYIAKLQQDGKETAKKIMMLK